VNSPLPRDVATRFLEQAALQDPSGVAARLSMIPIRLANAPVPVGLGFEVVDTIIELLAGDRADPGDKLRDSDGAVREPGSR
jgi:hypothetical protein